MLRKALKVLGWIMIWTLFLLAMAWIGLTIGPTLGPTEGRIFGCVIFVVLYYGTMYILGFLPTKKPGETFINYLREKNEDLFGPFYQELDALNRGEIIRRQR